jgi:hypothetical protein
VLRLRASALLGAGMLPEDLLLAATEGGAPTDAVSCTVSGCRVRNVAVGPAIAHTERHIGSAKIR